MTSCRSMIYIFVKYSSGYFQLEKSEKTLLKLNLQHSLLRSKTFVTSLNWARVNEMQRTYTNFYMKYTK